MHAAPRPPHLRLVGDGIAHVTGGAALAVHKIEHLVGGEAGSTRGGGVCEGVGQLGQQGGGLRSRGL